MQSAIHEPAVTIPPATKQNIQQTKCVRACLQGSGSSCLVRFAAAKPWETTNYTNSRKTPEENSCTVLTTGTRRRPQHSILPSMNPSTKRSSNQKPSTQELTLLTSHGLMFVELLLRIREQSFGNKFTTWKLVIVVMSSSYNVSRRLFRSRRLDINLARSYQKTRSFMNNCS